MEFNPVPIGSCSKENQIIYQQFFNYADSDGDGRITGSDATKFFAMSNLSRQDLKQVLYFMFFIAIIDSNDSGVAIADSKRQGSLGFAEFIIAMQLISLAQSSQPITQELLSSGVELKNLKWLSFQIMKC
ncbi:EH domain-containing protein [Arachis hypogaea]|nr:EH domain-containing protein [Arachis hypogaea]